MLRTSTRAPLQHTWSTNTCGKRCKHQTPNNIVSFEPQTCSKPMRPGSTAPSRSRRFRAGWIRIATKFCGIEDVQAGGWAASATRQSSDLSSGCGWRCATALAQQQRGALEVTRRPLAAAAAAESCSLSLSHTTRRVRLFASSPRSNSTCVLLHWQGLKTARGRAWRQQMSAYAI